MDNELFELCEGVYKLLPDWNGDMDWFIEQDGEIFVGSRIVHPGRQKSIAPLYTSDYILEKLREAGLGRVIAGFSRGFETAFANYTSALDEDNDKETRSDTPLKALLKLVLVLKEAGEL